MARRKRPNVPPLRVPVEVEAVPISEPSMRVLHEGPAEAEIVRPVRDLKERLDVRQEGKEIVVNIIADPGVEKAAEAILKGAAKARPLGGRPMAILLKTPPPWTKEFLDANGLRVRYAHGRAILEEKR